MEPLRGSEPVVPGYEMVGRLGSGGFGTVYAAVDAAGDRVAVKVLRSELSDDRELLSRLEREAAALQQVTGEHTAKIREVNTQGEHAFLVMDLIEGQNLEEHVRDKGPLKGFELRVVVEELVAALGEIHRAGVIHRDLKPSNVMYGPAGITLLDFGISSIADSTALTKSGTFIGTAGWISPEQIEGRSVSVATDVFNLGLVVAYGATGRHPFGSGRPEGIMYRICHHEPDLGDLGEPIRGLVAECLNRDETTRVTVDDIQEFVRSDFSSALRFSGVSKSASESVAGYSPTQQISSGRDPRPVAIREAGGSPSQGSGGRIVESDKRSSRKGLFVLAAISVVAAVGAVVALSLTQSRPEATATSVVSASATTSTALVERSTATVTETSNGPVEPTTSTGVSENAASEDINVVASVPSQNRNSPTLASSGPKGAVDMEPRATRYSTILRQDQTFELSIQLVDRDGVRDAWLRVRTSSGLEPIEGCDRNRALLVAGDQFDGKWTATCPLSNLNGLETSSSICSVDNFGNEGCSIVHQMWVSSNDDLDPPVLTDFRLSPNPVRAGASFVVSVGLRDSAGIADATLYVLSIEDFDCEAFASLVSGSLNDGVFEAKCWVPESAPSGSYGLGLKARDTNGIPLISEYFVYVQVD